MKIAIPTTGSTMEHHFGHCEKFTLLDIEGKKITGEEVVSPPEHKPGVYPRFLVEKGVNLVLAGSMGQNAKRILAHNNIEVIAGLEGGQPASLVEDYLNDRLRMGESHCTH